MDDNSHTVSASWYHTLDFPAVTMHDWLNVQLENMEIKALCGIDNPKFLWNSKLTADLLWPLWPLILYFVNVPSKSAITWPKKTENEKRNTKLSLYKNLFSYQPLNLLWPSMLNSYTLLTPTSFQPHTPNRLTHVPSHKLQLMSNETISTIHPANNGSISFCKARGIKHRISCN